MSDFTFRELLNVLRRLDPLVVRTHVHEMLRGPDYTRIPGVCSGAEPNGCPFEKRFSITARHLGRHETAEVHDKV